MFKSGFMRRTRVKSFVALAKQFVVVGSAGMINLKLPTTTQKGQGHTTKARWMVGFKGGRQRAKKLWHRFYRGAWEEKNLRQTSLLKWANMSHVQCALALTVSEDGQHSTRWAANGSTMTWTAVNKFFLPYGVNFVEHMCGDQFGPSPDVWREASTAARYPVFCK